MNKLKLSFNAPAKQFQFDRKIASKIETGMAEGLGAIGAQRDNKLYESDNGIEAKRYIVLEVGTRLSLTDVHNAATSVVGRLNTLLDWMKKPEKIDFKVSENPQAEQFEMNVELLTPNAPA